ncbi:unnamed protein product [Urochloa humidicola]
MPPSACAVARHDAIQYLAGKKVRSPSIPLATLMVCRFLQILHRFLGWTDVDPVGGPYMGARGLEGGRGVPKTAFQDDLSSKAGSSVKLFSCSV